MQKNIYKNRKEKNINEVIKRIKPVCIQYKGNIPIYLYINETRKSFLINKDLWINGDIDILKFFHNNFGLENVKTI